MTAVNISERDYAEILEHAAHPPGLRLTIRNALVSTLDDATIAEVLRCPRLRRSDRHRGAQSGRRLRPRARPMRRPSPTATRTAMIVALLMLPDTATEAEVEHALVSWRAVAARGIGTYLNFQGSATASDVAGGVPA